MGVGGEWQVEKSHRIQIVGPESKIRDPSKARSWKRHKGEKIWKLDLKFSFEIMPN